MTIYKTRKLFQFNSFNSKEQRITFGTVNYNISIVIYLYLYILFYMSNCKL